MKKNEQYRVRGLPDQVIRCEIAGRTVDYWAPNKPTHLLIAHDGQNIFDPRTATRRFTWRLAQNALRVFTDAGLTPPAIIAVFHSSSPKDVHGRYKDLTPQRAFEEDVAPPADSPIGLEDLRGNEYQRSIAEEIVPAVLEDLKFDATFENTAMLGSSMGGLATLNALGLRHDFFRTALAFSPHWVIGGRDLVDSMLKELPEPGKHKIWMSRGDRKLDATYEIDQNYANQLMRQRGWHHEFKSTVFPGAGHNERAWAKQVSSALKFWLQD